MAVTKRRARKSALRSRRVTPGTSLQSLVMDYFAARRIRCKRNNVGVARYGAHFVKYGQLGEADIEAHVPIPGVPNGFYILNCEVKAGRDRQRMEQRIWEAGVVASGEYYLIVRKLEDVEEWLKERGI